MNNVFGSWVLQQMRDERVRVLVAKSEVELKSLWDRWDGCSNVDGHDGDDIHMALNIKGHGHYCAV